MNTTPATNLQTRFIFNSTPLKTSKVFSPPTESDYPLVSFKTSHFDHVYRNTTDYVRNILDSVQFQGRKHTNVDVKVHNVVKGMTCALRGFHTDGYIDPRIDSSDDIYHLFVSGSAALTEFIAEPIELKLPEEFQGNNQKLLDDFKLQIKKINPKITKVKSCTMTNYGRTDFHRSSIGLFAEKRLLVRVTESDTLRPNNKELICKNY